MTKLKRLDWTMALGLDYFITLLLLFKYLNKVDPLINSSSQINIS